MWQCKSQLTLQEGVLYYKWEEGNETRLKLIVPQSLKDEVLSHVLQGRRTLWTRQNHTKSKKIILLVPHESGHKAVCKKLFNM